MLAVCAARAARLLAADRLVFFFVFFDFVVFFACVAEPALDLPVVALPDWPAKGPDNNSAESATTSHREVHRDADEGEDKTMSSLYSFWPQREELGISRVNEAKIKRKSLACVLPWLFPTGQV